MLELRARRRTGSGIRALLDLAPKIAHGYLNGSKEDVPLAQVKTRLRIRPGIESPDDTAPRIIRTVPIASYHSRLNRAEA